MNIILVDNNLVFLKSLEMLLRARGHCVVTFSDPVIAIQQNGLIHWDNDEAPIYLVDYLMPHLNGVELYNQTRNQPHAKYGMLTGHFETVTQELKNRDYSSLTLFSKPVDLNQIFNFIENGAA